MIAVLLTATIQPQVQSFSQRQDPQQRLEDYFRALQKWKTAGADLLVFCENSGYAVPQLREWAASVEHPVVRIEQFTETQEARERGKGYFELRLMEHAMRNVPELREADFVWKTTGRYFVENFAAVSSSFVGKKTDVALDFHNNLIWADSRFFGFSPAFFSDYLAGHEDEIDDSCGRPFEKVLARCALKALGEGRSWAPLPANPEIFGARGVDGAEWQQQGFDSFVARNVHRIKNHLNRTVLYDQSIRFGDVLRGVGKFFR